MSKNVKETHFDKLWKIPGIPEAVNMLIIHAYTSGLHDSREMILNGDLGEEIRALYIELSDDEPIYFAREEIEECESECVGKRKAEFCNKMVPKIVELWELTDDDMQVLVDWLLSGDDKAGDRIYRFIVPSVEEEKKIEIEVNCLESTGIKTKISSQMDDKSRIYLDVTDIDRDSLAEAYKALNYFREQSVVGSKSIKKGAPETINTTRALSCAYAEKRGMNRKVIAKSLRFPIYSGDNPSGSHPLFYKYLNKGRELVRKLDELSDDLQELTGIEVNYDWFQDKMIR